MFKPLNKDNLSYIVDLLIGGVNKMLEDKEVSIRLTDAAKTFVIDNGYDPNFGARPLKRYIQRTVETLAARIILEGDIDTGSVIEIDVKDGKLDAKVVK